MDKYQEALSVLIDAIERRYGGATTPKQRANAIGGGIEEALTAAKDVIGWKPEEDPRDRLIAEAKAKLAAQFRE
jgi:hypothetical protein